jgi:hypothetical protein
MNILYPAFALFALTMFVQFRLAALRLAAVKSGEIDARFFRTYADYPEPEKLRVYSRHLVNLYEAPVLFYAVVLIAFVSNQAGTLPVALAWLYVAARVAHSYAHLGANRVLPRFRLFAASLGILIALWATVLTGMLIG